MRAFDTSSRSQSDSRVASAFMNKVYLFMTLGLLLTAIVAYLFHTHPLLSQAIMRSKFAFFSIIIAQLGAVLIFSRTLRNMNPTASFLLYFFYAALTGVTFGILSFVYTAENIGYAFAITAGSFFALSLVGYTTKKDLGPIGSFCFMGLIGLVIISLLAMFIPALRGNTMELAMSAIGVIVFAGLTAYHTQKIKAMAQQNNHEVAAISGAFMLYLDFINLFLSILRFFGARR